MGQKVNPIGLRIGIVENWRSNWFANDREFKEFLKEDILIRDYLRKRFPRGSISRIDIHKFAEKIRITIYTTRPGVILGRRGSEINKVRDAPVIQESGEYKYTLHLGTIEGGELKVVRFHIKTFSHTPDGVYFVRFSIFFNYNGSLHKMWSPGYFSREVWDNATRNHTLNLTYLSKAIGEPVDGIVPDSSFSVKRSLMWIFYVLLGITIFVGILAFYTYFREEGKIRKEEENIYRLKGKYRYLEKELREKLKKIRNQ